MRSAGSRLAANGRRTRDLKSRPRRTTAPSQCQQQCRAKSSRAPDGFPRPALLCLPYCQHGMPGISRRGAERPNPTGPRSAAISDRQGAFRGPHCGGVLSVSVQGSVYFPGAAPPRCVFRPHNFAGGKLPGWLFLPSTPTQRESLRPLLSMWLDSLILRLMEFGQKGVPPVWFMLDELASLQQLPQLPTVITGKGGAIVFEAP